MNALPIYVIALACVSIVSGQSQLSDDMIRKLGGDPVALRADALRRQKEAPTAEEVALRQRAESMSKSITTEQIAGLQSNDPLLAALYANRVRLFDDSLSRWAHVIDLDIQRRKEAGAVMMKVFKYDRQMNEQYYVMYWLNKHGDLKWGDEIMEEAIHLYRADPKKWNSSGVAALRRLVASRGNESHLTFFDELDKTEFGGGDERAVLEHRIKMAREKATPAPSNTKPAAPDTHLPKPAQPVPLGQTKKQPKEKGTRLPEWIVGIIIVIATTGLLWFLLKWRS